MALGDCAVTSNVPAMRNTVPVKKLLDRVYVEGADTNQRIPTENVPALLRHAAAGAGGGEGGPARARLPAAAPTPSAFVIGELLEGRKPDLAGKVKFG